MLALSLSSGHVHAQRVERVAAVQLPIASDIRLAPPLPRASAEAMPPDRQTPTWLRWGLIGAAAGAVTFPLLGSMASDSPHHPARDAIVGAAAGFVVIGGGVALWQALCGPDSPSRRAGMCGR